MRLRTFVPAILMIFAGSPALAQNCGSIPNQLTNGTTADATKVMGDFNYLGGCAASIASPSFNGTANFSGNIGVGTGSPDNTLEILGGSNNAGTQLSLETPGTQSSQHVAVVLVTKSSGTSGGLGTSNDRGWQVDARGDSFTGQADDFFLNYWNGSGFIQPFTVTPSGNVGIGTTTPNFTLTVNGQIYASGGGNIVSSTNMGWQSTATASAGLCYTTFVGIYIPEPCTSLSQYKLHQKTLTFGLDTLMRMHPVEFDWDKQHGDRHDLGFIAQEVEKINPLLAEYDYKDGKPKLIGVKYMQMTSLLTRSVQEQEFKILSLNEIVAEQTATITKLRAQSRQQQSINASLAADNATLNATVDKIRAGVSRLERNNMFLRAEQAKLEHRLSSLESAAQNRARIHEASR